MNRAKIKALALANPCIYDFAEALIAAATVKSIWVCRGCHNLKTPQDATFGGHYCSEACILIE